MTVPTTGSNYVSLSMTHIQALGAHTRNEVERQVHEVPHKSLRAESGERSLEDLSEPSHGVTARLQLPALAHNVGSTSSDKRAVERVQEGILKEEVSGQHRDNGRALAEDEDNRGKDSKRSVYEDENGKLRHVGEGEHGGYDADREPDRRDEFLEERLPQ
jgi:hypothetical protein